MLQTPEIEGFGGQKAHINADFVLKRPENGGLGGKKRTKTPILCSGASPMVGLIHSFNKRGRPESHYDFIRSPVWVLCSALCLPPRLRVSRSTLLILTNRANYVNSRIQRLLLESHRR